MDPKPLAPSPFHSDGSQYAWDNTSLRWAQSCLQLYKYKMIDRYEAKAKSHHLLFGGWYASALEKFYKLRAEGMEYEEALREVLLITLRATWEYALNEDGSPKLDTAGNHIGAPWISPATDKTRENLIRSIIWYCEDFRDDAVKTVILPGGTPAVEYSFRLEIDYGNILTGHLDRFCEYGEAYYIMDQKTTGHTITQHFFEQFDGDPQFSTYLFAGQAIFDKPVKGVIIDGAQIAVGFTRYQRGYTFRTPQQLDEWYEDSMHHIERAQNAVRENHFPHTWTACYNCDFKNVCNKSPGLRERYLEGNFYKRPLWNPLEER